jgi:hypothetical protein
LIHALERYRPEGSYRREDPNFTPPPAPCPYPRKVIMEVVPGVNPHGYAIEIGRGATGPCPMLTTTGDCTFQVNHGGPHSDGNWTDRGRSRRSYRDRGVEGAPRYHSCDEFYPVLERLARELGELWSEERRDEPIARRTGVPIKIVRYAKDSPADAVPVLIKYFRKIGVGMETLNKHRADFKMLHPELRTRAARQARLDEMIDTFLAICPPPIK